MKRMTRGEFRGLLVLSGVMVGVLIYSWMNKPGGVAEPASSPKSDASELNIELSEQQGKSNAPGLQLSKADSLKIEVAARNAEHTDSVRRSHRVVAKEGRRSKVSGKDKPASPRKGKGRSGERCPTAVPSPLDRDI